MKSKRSKNDCIKSLKQCIVGEWKYHLRRVMRGKTTVFGPVKRLLLALAKRVGSRIQRNSDQYAEIFMKILSNYSLSLTFVWWPFEFLHHFHLNLSTFNITKFLYGNTRLVFQFAVLIGQVFMYFLTPGRKTKGSASSSGSSNVDRSDSTTSWEFHTPQPLKK